MTTTAVLFQIFGSLFKTFSGNMESGPGAFPGFSCWSARANSSEVNSPEIHLCSGVGILQRSDTSLFTSLYDSRYLVLYDLFFTSCDTMDLAVMRHGRCGFLDLPVRLLIVVQANRLECVDYALCGYFIVAIPEN